METIPLMTSIISATSALLSLTVSYLAYSFLKSKEKPIVYCSAGPHGVSICLCVYNSSTRSIEDVTISYDAKYAKTKEEEDKGFELGLPGDGFKIGLIPQDMKYIAPILIYRRDKVIEMENFESKLFDFIENANVNICYTISGKRKSETKRILNVSGRTFGNPETKKKSRIIAPTNYHFEDDY